MVKTVRGLLSLKELKQLLTDYARTLDNYTRVENDKISLIFYPDRIRIEIKEPRREECYACKGSGKWEDGKTCWLCHGTGVWQTDSRLITYITEYDEYPHYGTLKIEVHTNGTNPEIWKPDVEKIKNFIEKLAGKPCVIVPTPKGGKTSKIKAVPLSDIHSLTRFLR